MTTTWRKEITSVAKLNNEAFEDIVTTLSEAELDIEFDEGYGGAEGRPFTAWGPNWVYFPVVYDGLEWVGSAPRNPCDFKTPHQGGE